MTYHIEAIILDIGGVIWQPKVTPLRDKWAARCGLEPAEFDRIIYGSDWSELALIGAITSEEIWANVGQQLNLAGATLEELRQDYWAGQWDTDLLDFVRQLKPHYKLGIISDAYSGARRNVRPWVNEELFDVILFSAEEGICKPNPRIFHRALTQLGVTAPAAIFIDDRATNVAGADRVGIHAIQYSNFMQMVRTLKNYGVSI